MLVVTKAVAALQAVLTERGWTQNELARQLGTNTAAVSRWVNGERKPGLALALKIESLLGVEAKLWLEAADASGSHAAVTPDKTG